LPESGCDKNGVVVGLHSGSKGAFSIQCALLEVENALYHGKLQHSLGGALSQDTMLLIFLALLRLWIVTVRWVLASVTAT
jgi:hypothetical protein